MQSVLKKLGLTEDNPGVFHGEWCGGGAKIDKISPIDGKKIASFRNRVRAGIRNSDRPRA